MDHAPKLSSSLLQQLCIGPSYGATDRGLVRHANEDNFLIDPLTSLAVVADGMGGHQAGARASSEALITLHHYLEQACGQPDAGNAASNDDATVPLGLLQAQAVHRALDADPALALRSAVQVANYRLYLHNLSLSLADGYGMGTTLTGLWTGAPSAGLYSFHVGDSRLYRLREGHLQCLTRDQTLYQRAIDAGQTLNLPARHMLWQALGPYDRVEPDIQLHDWQHGDLFLLCSDGLHAAVPPAELGLALRQADPARPDLACEALVRLARAHGGRDNITAVLLACLA